MKLALLTNGIHPFIIGGMQKHSFYLIKYLVKNDVYVDVYHPDVDDKNNLLLDLFSIKEQQFLKFVIVPNSNKYKFPGHYLLEEYLFSKNIYNQLIQNNSYDFIYSQGFSAWYCFNNRKSISTPIGVNFHGLNMFQQTFGFSNKLIQLLFKPFVSYNLRKADIVFSLGGKLTNINIEQSGKSLSSIIESNIGVDKIAKQPEEINAGSNRSFVFVGRFDKIKGFEIINEAIERLNNDNFNFEFNFIGPIPDSIKISANNVKYLGEIKSEENLIRSLGCNDVLVLASISEGMPTVILEAMSAGLAIISTNVGAVEKLVDDTNGVLILPNNPSELCMAMIKMINLPSVELIKLKRSSIQKIQQDFLWDKIIAKLLLDLKKN